MSTLPLFVLLAVPLCSWLGIRGLAVCFALLVLGMAVDLRELSVTDRVWHMGIGGAISLALLLMILAREEVQQLCSGFAQERSDGYAAQLHAAHERIRELEDRLGSTEAQVAKAAQEYALSHDASQSQLQQAVLQYQELRGQFEEKGQVLRQTRGTVWQVETRLEVLLREQAESAISEEIGHEHLLTQIAELVGAQLVQEDEIKQLEELVSKLLAELKQRCVPGSLNLSALQRLQR